MEHRIIPCAEGDDKFIADKLNAITNSKIDFEDTIEDELVVFKVTDSDGNIIAGCNLIIDCWKHAELDILWADFVQGSPAAKEKPADKVKCVVWDLDNTFWDGILIETDDPNTLKPLPGVLDDGEVAGNQ